MMADQRNRNFTFVLYPESAPKNWKQILEDLAVPCFISPLHDKDVIAETGEPKKPHWHILLMFGGKKSVDQVLEMIQPLNVHYVDIVNDIRGASRYLCHLDFFDRSDKRLYDIAGVTSLCGADYNFVCSLPSDRRVAIAQMSEFLIHNDIKEFWDFYVYCYLNEPTWFYVITESDTNLFAKLLKSKHFKFDYLQKEGESK